MLKCVLMLMVMLMVMLSWVGTGGDGPLFVFLLIDWPPASPVVMSKASTRRVQNAPASAQLNGSHQLFLQHGSEESAGTDSDQNGCELYTVLFSCLRYIRAHKVTSRNGFVADN